MPDDRSCVCRVAPVAVLDNDWIFLYNTLNAWGILRDTEDIFRETKTGT